MNSSIDYKKAGVDIEAGNELVERIKPAIKKTYSSHVVAGVGGFAALYAIPKGYKNPLLVSSTDGVGTKLKLAIEYQNSDTVGIDLVAMCVNDLLCVGAKPLYFLDYYASGKLKVDLAARVIESIAEGCLESEMSLIGGETAEMPGMYAKDDYDLAGFCVGIVDKNKMIDGSKVKVGDVLIGIPSSGFHSNGYSLIRKILENNPSWKNQRKNLIQELLEPTRIYHKLVQKALSQFKIKAISHITGGGLLENIPRVYSSEYLAKIELGSWPIPEIMKEAKTLAGLSDFEFYRTFNCGIGLVFILSAKKTKQFIDFLAKEGEAAYVIGTIEKSQGKQIQIGDISQ